MTIYFDLSAAVHRRAGLGRYAESLARALIPLLGDRLGFFYNAEEGVQPVDGLDCRPDPHGLARLQAVADARLAGAAGPRAVQPAACPAASSTTRPSTC